MKFAAQTLMFEDTWWVRVHFKNYKDLFCWIIYEKSKVVNQEGNNIIVFEDKGADIKITEN